MGVQRFIQNLGLLGKVDVPGLQQRVEQQAQQLKDQEERANTFYSLTSSALGDYYINDKEYTPSDVLGSQHQSMRVSTVFACVLVRAESLSTLPASVLQYTPTGSKVATKQAVHKLVHDKPNPFQTAAQFWKTVSAHIDLNGECMVKVTYSGRLQPTRLDIIENPSAVEVLESAAGNCYFRYEGKTYEDYEFLHFKDLSLDGYRGCSKIKYNMETVGYLKKLRKYGGNAVGVKPPGYFSTEAPYAAIKNQEKDLQENWAESISNGHPPFLPFATKYFNLQISPDEAQYLQSIGATKEEISGIFRVPPTLLQDYSKSPYNTSEQQDLVFVKYTMLPIITNIEQECNAKLFPESNNNSDTPFYVKFNVNAFMRGDFKTRTEGYKTLVQNGLISINQVAELEDWARVEGGDERYLPMNVIPLSMQKQFIDKLTAPVSTNAGNEGGADNDKRHDDFVREILDGIKKGLNKNGHHVN